MTSGNSREGVMETKVLKTEKDYSAALTSIEHLMDLNPKRGTAEAEELELLALLVREYEARQWPISVPDPVDAIQFRMEQQQLSQRDLVPFIGSKSKVSEVLARKRPLTLPMLRALHTGLGIPAAVLLKEGAQADDLEQGLEWSNFPLRDMVSRGWITAAIADIDERCEELMRGFLAPLGPMKRAMALYKMTPSHIRSARTMDKFALFAWSARILLRAMESPCPRPYNKGVVNLEFMRQVALLSSYDSGPVLAQEFLGKYGIRLIVEPHLPKTHLDGAAILSSSDEPVIGLTLRHDRIDNFWFVLLHELAHIAKHLSNDFQLFFDDLDASGNDLREKEADELAGEALIPAKAWKTSTARVLRSPEAAQHLADKLRIHPAIVAGRMRHESKNYRILNQLVGSGRVRPLFSEFARN